MQRKSHAIARVGSGKPDPIFISKLGNSQNNNLEILETKLNLKIESKLSTIDQDLEKNKSEILQLADDKKLGHMEFIEEKVSGKVSLKQRQIATILDQLGEEIISVAVEKKIKSIA